MSPITLTRRAAEPLRCRELIALLTDLLEGTLPPAEARRAERHLADCPHCEAYLESLRLTLRALGRLTEADLSPTVHDELMARFRHWRAGDG